MTKITYKIENHNNMKEVKDANPLLITGIVIHLIITGVVAASPDYGIGLALLLLPFVALNLIGFGMIQAKKLKAGCIVYAIGSILFVPIGMIGLMGVRKIMNKLKEEKFAAELQANNG